MKGIVEFVAGIGALAATLGAAVLVLGTIWGALGFWGSHLPALIFGAALIALGVTPFMLYWFLGRRYRPDWFRPNVWPPR